MKPPRIDSHQQFWRYRSSQYPWIGAGMDLLAQDRLPYQFQPLLEAQGLHASIAVQAAPGREESSFLQELAHHERCIAGVIAWEDIAAPDLSARAAQWGDKLKGFRHGGGDDSAALQRGMRWLQAQHYSVDVMADAGQLAQLPAFCARHDQHWLVLNHLGKPALRHFRKDKRAFPRWRDELHALAAMPHVACKISGLVTEADWLRGLSPMDYEHIVLCLDAALDAFGPQRLMFGSDWPVCLLAASYSRVASVVEQWAQQRLSAADQAALWGGTASRCYRLDA